MRDHSKLRAFELADEVVLMVYRITKHFPKEEIFGMTSQMRRAGVSVPSNIIEGCGRKSKAEYKRFLEIAFASLKELHYQFGLAYKLKYVRENDVEPCELKFEETENVLASLIRSIRL